MSPFDERRFFENDLGPVISKLAKSKGKIRLSRLIHWYQRLRNLAKAPSPRPFLFSDLKRELLKEVGSDTPLLKRPAFQVAEDLYVKARFQELKEALLGTCYSLSSVARSPVRWGFSAGEALTVTYSFRSSYEGFDLAGFCSKLVVSGGKSFDFDAGYPFLEAVVDGAGGQCEWNWHGRRWELTVAVPVHRIR